MASEPRQLASDACARVKHSQRLLTSPVTRREKIWFRACAAKISSVPSRPVSWLLIGPVADGSVENNGHDNEQFRALSGHLTIRCDPRKYRNSRILYRGSSATLSPNDPSNGARRRSQTGERSAPKRRQKKPLRKEATASSKYGFLRKAWTTARYPRSTLELSIFRLLRRGCSSTRQKLCRRHVYCARGCKP